MLKKIISISNICCQMVQRLLSAFIDVWLHFKFWKRYCAYIWLNKILQRITGIDLSVCILIFQWKCISPADLPRLAWHLAWSCFCFNFAWTSSAWKLEETVWIVILYCCIVSVLLSCFVNFSSYSGLMQQFQYYMFIVSMTRLVL